MADTGKHMSRSKSKSGAKLKYTTIVSNVEGNDSKTENDLSLQEAFKRYRKAKQKELKKAKLLRKRNELRKADPAKMAALRKKFIEQAKKYFGYPYARKYWPPDSPEYKSKLFLDCCGLVRQVMRDLTYDFGFVIGPWNQAYMYDTLPKTVAREEDMQPGDLVFVSATYVNPKSKKQRHNMTHVEIWLGDGPKTIGARWNNGKVQIWDHYKFKAKSYYNETYHLKSIDTWLKGICESFCADHRWKRRKYVPSKKSIFHVESDQSLTDEQDERAGDDGDEEDTMACENNADTDAVKDKPTGDRKNKIRDNKDTDGDDDNDDGEETDDEMCNASPDSDEGEDDVNEEVDEVNGGSDIDDDDNIDDENNSSNSPRKKIGIEDLCLSEQFSVDLNNRGLYLQDLVEKCEQGHNDKGYDKKNITDKLNTKNTPVESDNNDKEQKELTSDINETSEKDNVNIGGVSTLGAQDNTTDVPPGKDLPDKFADTSITDELQNLSKTIESALTNQKTDIPGTNSGNLNQNALPRKDGPSSGKQTKYKVTLVPSTCSIIDNNDGAGCSIGAESVASDISIASSQISDKGAK